MTPETDAAFHTWLAEAQAAGQTDSYSGKRGERRHAWRAHLELRHGENTYTVNGYDISSLGAGIIIRHALQTGDVVQLRRDPHEPWIPLRVAHVTQTVGGYRIGLRLDDVKPTKT